MEKFLVMPDNENDAGFSHLETIILRFQLFAEPVCNFSPLNMDLI